jgi:hypothetical protein
MWIFPDFGTKQVTQVAVDVVTASAGLLPLCCQPLMPEDCPPC